MSNNIQVAIRVRPLIAREKKEKLKEQWEMNQNMMYPIDSTTGKKSGDNYFFDHIFTSTCPNERIYKTIVHPVVDAAMNGFNGTVFAYGQTSSGKTYTMMGNKDEPGIISLTVENIFVAIEKLVNRKFLLRVSYMEIYNEKIYDLLDSKNEVKVHEDLNGIVLKVKEKVTDSAEMVFQFKEKGDKVRTIGETNMNEKSSRSHTIFRIIIESSDLNDNDNHGVAHVAHLNLVDLAGSERATHTKSTGVRLKEGANINKSLSALSLVMKQLSENQEFINFRDSKLTRILQSSLGGNALTTIICAVTPAALEETHSTLAFASRAKTVKNKPQLNEILTDEALINKYAQQITQLTNNLEKAKNEKEQIQASMSEQSEKISILQKHIIHSSQSTINKKNNAKNRRRTWCASASPLPVIYEKNVLQMKPTEEEEEEDVDQLETKVFSKDADWFNTPTERNRKPLSSVSSKNSTLVDDNFDTEEVERPEDFVKWLVHETETPKSILRDRAAYYEREFLSLKELTNAQKTLLEEEHNIEFNSLKSELELTKQYLESTKNAKETSEKKFAIEKSLLENKITELNKKNNELLIRVSKAERENQKHNDSEYLVEFNQEKYRKREKELLDTLEETKAMLQMKTSFIDNTDTKMDVQLQFKDSEELESFLNIIKEKFNVLVEKFDTKQSCSEILNYLNDLIKENEKIENQIFPDEIQEYVALIKSMIDVFRILVQGDDLIIQKEKEKSELLTIIGNLQKKQRAYDELLKKQTDEIKLVTSCLNELGMNKSLTVDMNTQKESNENVSVTDIKLWSNTLLENKSNLERFDSDSLESVQKNVSGTLSLDELIIKVDQELQTDDYFDNLIKMKDKEIEDLSDKIMDYIDQLTEAEKQLKKYKIIKLDQVIQTDKDEKILDLEETITLLTNQLNSKNSHNEQLLNEIHLIKIQLEEAQSIAKNEELTNNEIKDLHENNLNKLLKSEQELNLLNLTSIQNELQNKEDEIKDLKKQNNNLIKMKDKEIEDLSDKIMDYIDQLTEAENQLRKYKIIKLDQVIQTDEDEKILDLKESITLLTNQLNSKSSHNEKLLNEIHLIKIQLEKAQSIAKNEELTNNEIKDLHENELQNKEDEIIDLKKQNDNLIKMKDKEIEDLSDKIMDYIDQLTEAENQLRKYKIIKLDQVIQTDEDEKILDLKESITLLTNQLNSKSSHNEKLLNEIHLIKIQLEKAQSIAKNEELTNNEIKDLHEKISNQKIELDNKNKETKQLVENINGLTKQLSDREYKLKDLKLILESNAKDITDYSEKLLLNTKELNIKKDEIKKLLEEHTLLQNQMTSANNEINELQKQNIEFNHKNNNLNKLLKSEQELNLLKLKSMQNELQNKEDEIKDLKKQNDALSLSFESEKFKLLQEYENNVRKLKADFLLNKENIIAITKELEVMKDTNKEIGCLNEELCKKLCTLEEQNLLKDKNIKNSQETIVSYKNALNTAQNEILKYTSVRKIDNTTQSDLIDDNENLALKLELQNREDKIKELNAQLYLTLEQKESEFQEFENNIKKLNNQNFELNDEIKDLKTQTNTLSLALKIKKSELLEYENNINKLKNDLFVYEEERIIIRKELEINKNKTKEIDRLNESIKKLKMELSLKEENTKIMAKKFDTINSKNVEICYANEKLRKDLLDLQEKYVNNENKLSQCKCSDSKMEREKLKDLKNTENITQFDFESSTKKEFEALRKENTELKNDNDKMAKTWSDNVTKYRQVITKLQTEKDTWLREKDADFKKRQILETQIATLQKTLINYKTSVNIDNKYESENLEKQNRSLLKIIDDLRADLKKNGTLALNIEMLKEENNDLIKRISNLTKQLSETEERLKCALSTIELLEKENSNYHENTRHLEETLEGAKYDLYELKKKERAKNMKEKRQSLHDSSRGLPRNAAEESSAKEVYHNNQHSSEESLGFENSDYYKEKLLETSSKVNCDHCKHKPITDKEIQEQDRYISELKESNNRLRKRNEQLTTVCKLRKAKIDELEQHAKS